MAVYTPKGLKIRWDADSAFSLIARLYPKRRVKDVFRLTEALDVMPSSASLIAGLICFYLKLDLLKIFAIVGAVRLLAYCLIHWNIMLPVLPSIGRIYNRVINWFLFPWIVPIVAGYFMMGWEAVLIFYTGITSGWILEFVIVMIKGRKTFKQFGFSFTQSEYAFIMAYRYFADKDGKSMDFTDFEGEEFELVFWIETYKDYAQTHPTAAAMSIKEYSDKNGYSISF